MIDTTSSEPPAGPDGSVDSTLVALPPIKGSSDPPTDGLRAAALAYVIAVLAAGLATIVVFAPQIDRGEIPALILIGALAVGFSRVRMTIYGETALSIGMVGDFAVAFLFGPAGAAITSPLAAIVFDSGGSGPWYKRAFNIGAFSLVNVATASLVWLLMGGELVRSVWLIPIALLAVAFYYLLNISLVTIAVSLSAARPLREVWREKFEWLVPHYIVFGMLGLALAVAYDAIGVFGVLAFVAPPLMMQYSVRQYLTKTEENVEELRKANDELHRANADILHMANQLRETYDGTLEALVSALDARDRETKGHSVRVAKYMMEIAYHIGIPSGTDEWVDMQRGALLHDVGKIGVSDSILHKPGPLSDDEWVDMRRHPKIGYDMLKDISFLSGAATIVLAHHERFDGKGYPRGLAADEIPLGARIFVLADTFDAMTSDRPYRSALTSEASRAEIIRCSGTQFDPTCVQAFLLAFDEIVEIRMADQERPTEQHATAAPRAA